jgi:hypothetical protein
LIRSYSLSKRPLDVIAFKVKLKPFIVVVLVGGNLMIINPAADTAPKEFAAKHIEP